MSPCYLLISALWPHVCLTLYLTIILTTQLLKLVWKEQIYSTWTPSVFNRNKLYLCVWYTYLSMALISRNRELKDKNSFSQSSFWEKPWPKQKGTNCSAGLKRLLLVTIGADGWWPLSAWNTIYSANQPSQRWLLSKPNRQTNYFGWYCWQTNYFGGIRYIKMEKATFWEKKKP